MPDDDDPGRPAGVDLRSPSAPESSAHYERRRQRRGESLILALPTAGVLRRTSAVTPLPQWIRVALFWESSPVVWLSGLPTRPDVVQHRARVQSTDVEPGETATAVPVGEGRKRAVELLGGRSAA